MRNCKASLAEVMRGKRSSTADQETPKIQSDFPRSTPKQQVHRQKSREGDPPNKPPTQIKTGLRKQFAQTSSGQFVQTVPLFPFKKKQKTDKRVCANSLCKLLLFGWVVFWVGRLPLKKISIMCKWTRPFGGTGCPEGTQKPRLGLGSPYLQCWHGESSKVLAGVSIL